MTLKSLEVIPNDLEDSITSVVLPVIDERLPGYSFFRRMPVHHL